MQTIHIRDKNICLQYLKLYSTKLKRYPCTVYYIGFYIFQKEYEQQQLSELARWSRKWLLTGIKIKLVGTSIYIGCWIKFENHVLLWVQQYLQQC